MNRSRNQKPDAERTLVLVYRADTNECQFQEGALRVLDGPEAGRSHALTSERMILGTSPDNDICLKDPFISRHHAEILQGPDGVVIKDLQSSNGTLLDGQPVSSAVLEHGATLTLGAIRLRFESHQASVPGPKRAKMSTKTEDPAAIIGRFAVETVHEVKNLLHGIRANAEYLAQQQGSNLPAVNILRGTEGIQHCVSKVLAFSRSDRVEKAPCDLAEVLNNTLMFWAPSLEDRGISLERDYRAGLQLVADARQLQELFGNLVENALHSMDRGGQLRVDAVADGDWISTRVADTGPGIPEENQERIFESFFTTRPTGQGTGLGLAICGRIAAAHAGTLKLEKTSAQGTTFLVRLPGAAR